jgi:hypothetical protein
MPRTDPMDIEQWAFDRQQEDYGDVSGMKSAFAGLSTPGDVKSKFGLTSNVSSIYAPLRRRLATQRGSALSSAATRMRGGTALPESTMLPIEGQFAGAEAGLESSEAQSQIGQEDFTAQLMRSIMGEQDQFGLQKAGLQSNIAAGVGAGADRKRQADYSQRDPTLADYLMQIVGPAANVWGAYAGAKGG